MPERVIIGTAELWLGDCLEVMPLLSGVHAVVTDPPFSDEAHTKQRRMLTSGEANGGRRREALRPVDFAPITDDTMDAFCQAEQIADWRAAMEAGGIKWRRAQLWVKTDGTPQFTGDRPGVGYEAIATGWCGSGRSVWNGGGKAASSQDQLFQPVVHAAPQQLDFPTEPL